MPALICSNQRCDLICSAARGEQQLSDRLKCMIVIGGQAASASQRLIVQGAPDVVLFQSPEARVAKLFKSMESPVLACSLALTLLSGPHYCILPLSSSSPVFGPLWSLISHFFGPSLRAGRHICDTFLYLARPLPIQSGRHSRRGKIISHKELVLDPRLDAFCLPCTLCALATAPYLMQA